MINLATFRARFPEFSKTTDAQVSAALDQSQATTDAVVFGALTDAAHGYMAAHLLCAWPGGKDTRIKGEAFVTTYLAERQRLEDYVGPAQIAAAELGG